MMKLPAGWLAIADSKEIPNGKPIGIKRLGEWLVLWRDSQGRVIVQLDKCPHRSAKLSLGSVTENTITCPYHGFQFAPDGTCRLVPETGRGAVNLKVRNYAVREEHGFIWVWHEAEAGPIGDPPWFDNIDSKFCYSQLTRTWPTHITRCIENQIDYTHLPFVHKQTIGRESNPQQKPVFTLDGERIRIQVNPSESESGFLELRLPNIWQLCISARLSLVIAFAPVDEQATTLYLRTYQKFLTAPVLREFAGWIMNFSNSVILNQDKAVVLSQWPSNAVDGDVGESLFPSDKAIEYFRRQWSNGFTSNK